MTRLMQALLKQGLLTKRIHRIRMLSQSITEGGANETFNLLVCDDEPNYDLTTDGTNVAECHPGAKIVAIQVVMTMYALQTSRVVEWVIGRDPDAAMGGASIFNIAQLFTADINTGAISNLRKNVWGAGHVVGSDRTSFETRLNITKALRRASKMLDGDIIRMVFTDDGAGTGNAQFYLRGRIITVGP